MKNNYRTICISDIHLGTRDCKADHLIHFLKHHTCDSLYLIGDIIDGWKVQQNKLKWAQSHTNVIRKILGLAKNGTEVIYIAGNHDEFLRPMIKLGISFGKISIHNQYTHVGIDGNRYLITHGDLFDGISNLAPWLSFVGDKAYDLILMVNNKFNWFRHQCGFGYWSLSKYLKHKVKSAIDFMFQFEINLTDYCKKRGFDGVIAGHVHNPEIKEINGTIYMNDGDFVESISALLETFDGDWILIHLDKNEWKPFQVRIANTGALISGDICMAWFEENGFSIIKYQDKE